MFTLPCGHERSAICTWNARVDSAAMLCPAAVARRERLRLAGASHVPLALAAETI